MQTYASQQVPAQKEPSHADFVLDTSSQSESLQRNANMANAAAQRAEAPRPNNTGMPDNLKSGIESLSGFSMDDVRVHYNSSKPATVQALAYTQGTDIHIAPGQEKHLPHEAWHVAQQMAGRVAPTTNINDMPVNDNAALEHEADVMGERAISLQKGPGVLQKGNVIHGTCQRETSVTYEYQEISYKATDDTSMTDEPPPTTPIGKKTTAQLDPDVPIKGTKPIRNELEDLMNAIQPSGYREKNPYIKGHLLNHNLGGLGIAENMAPLTENANALHEMFVEQGVKNLIYNGYKVDYTVTATVEGKKSSEPLSKENPPKTTFICNVKFNDYPTSSHDLETTITSGPEAEEASLEGQNITQQANNLIGNEKILDVTEKLLTSKKWGTITNTHGIKQQGYPYHPSRETMLNKTKVKVPKEDKEIGLVDYMKNKIDAPKEDKKDSMRKSTDSTSSMTRSGIKRQQSISATKIYHLPDSKRSKSDISPTKKSDISPTKITYSPQIINYIPSLTKQKSSPFEIIGGTTKAHLDPKFLTKGTEANSSDDQKDFMEAIKPLGYNKRNPYIRGHLLNHNLGGLGIAENMAPLTDNANKLHEMFVEQGVKNLLYNGHTVDYTIEANVKNSQPFNKNNPPKIEFVCTVKTNNSPKPIELSATITSGPEAEEASLEGQNITQQANNLIENTKKLDVTNDDLEYKERGETPIYNLELNSATSKTKPQTLAITNLESYKEKDRPKILTELTKDDTKMSLS